MPTEYKAARERLIFALDVSDGSTLTRLVDTLSPHVGMFKVGLELFMSRGPEVVQTLRHFRPVMLDLKLHDIPETVARAVDVAGDLGAKFVTLHVQQRETLEKAARVAEKYPGLTLLGVTVLTSMSADDMLDLMTLSSMGDVPNQVEPQVRARYLAQYAHEFGIRGFVCSPQEVQLLRAALPWHETSNLPRPILVTPGIRPKGASADDQKRQSTPRAAIESGADYLVVGRPIRDAPNPVAAAAEILREISYADLPA